MFLSAQPQSHHMLLSWLLQRHGRTSDSDRARCILLSSVVRCWSHRYTLPERPYYDFVSRARHIPPNMMPLQL